MNFYEGCGIAGSILLAYSNIPQIIKFIRQKHADGISLISTWLWLLGLLGKLVYTVYTTGYNKIIFYPYLFTIGCAIITLWYCYFGQKD
jgi:uncharacterized protein with PQ loop repeat